MPKNNSVSAEHKIEDFAADLGKMLGHARSKAEGWLGQRQTIVKNLTALRDEASKLLNQLGGGLDSIGRKRGRPAGSANGKIAPVKTRRKMSAKARAAISAAQKARWAKQKSAQK